MVLTPQRLTQFSTLNGVVSESLTKDGGNITVLIDKLILPIISQILDPLLCLKYNFKCCQIHYSSLNLRIIFCWVLQSYHSAHVKLDQSLIYKHVKIRKCNFQLGSIYRCISIALFYLFGNHQKAFSFYKVIIVMLYMLYSVNSTCTVCNLNSLAT